MSDEVIVTQRMDSVGVLTLNRPDRLNALDQELMRRLTAAVREMAEDENIRCVILTGADGNFCAGGDLHAIRHGAKDLTRASEPSTGDQMKRRARWIRRSAEASLLLHEMPKPTIAMIRGACAGAGLSLAAACDFRYAGNSARFKCAFTAIGMPGDYGGSWLWTKALGPARARQLYFFDELRSADEALQFGLVDEVFADEGLDDVVMARARTLAAVPGAALAYAKINLNAALEEGFAASLDRESMAMALARKALTGERSAKKL